MARKERLLPLRRAHLGRKGRRLLRFPYKLFPDAGKKAVKIRHLSDSFSRRPHGRSRPANTAVYNCVVYHTRGALCEIPKKIHTFVPTRARGRPPWHGPRKGPAAQARRAGRLLAPGPQRPCNRPLSDRGAGRTARDGFRIDRRSPCLRRKQGLLRLHLGFFSAVALKGTLRFHWRAQPAAARPGALPAKASALAVWVLCAVRPAYTGTFTTILRTGMAFPARQRGLCASSGASTT